MRSIVLTEEDFENERRLYEKERIYPVNNESMFRGGLWCVMTPGEKWQKLELLNKELLDRKLDTPERIIQNAQATKEITNKGFLGKFKRVYGFATWWQTTDLPERIRQDIANGRSEEYSLRKELVREAPGMGYKCGSYFFNLLEYKDVVAVDRWMLKLLRNRGYRYNHKRIQIPDFETIGGPTGKQYLTYEKIVQKLARSYGVFPAQFQRIVWIKSSGWKPRN